MFKIGNIEIKNQIVLAPIAGVSNPSYFKIVEEMDCGLAFTELISAESLIRGNIKTYNMLNGLDLIKMPDGVQIFGSDADVLARAAKILTIKYNVKLIDINMGCPVPKVALKAEAGSALLKNPKKIEQIVKKVVAAVDVPVTVKIRSGWDFEHQNAVQVAKICEAAGASAITVHARTRSQGYTGTADWNVIRSVKENVHIPVIGNGDVTTPFLAKKMLDETGCDAVMIGRGAIGNPWLIKECVAYLKDKTILEPPVIEEKIAVLKKHYEILKSNQNEKLALLEIRSQALQYLKGIPNSKELKQKIITAKTEEEFLSLLNSLI